MRNIKKEEYYLQKLVKVLNRHNLRRFTCLNNFGYSQIERDIVNELVDEDSVSHKVFALTLIFMVILAFWSGYNFHN